MDLSLDKYIQGKLIKIYNYLLLDKYLIMFFFIPIVHFFQIHDTYLQKSEPKQLILDMNP